VESLAGDRALINTVKGVGVAVKRQKSVAVKNDFTPGVHVPT
jgi:hypothetical protein